MEVRFLFDEHIDHVIAAALRLRGYDVLTVAEAQLLGATPPALLRFRLPQEASLESPIHLGRLFRRWP